jgi:magnesium chelatase subunit I
MTTIQDLKESGYAPKTIRQEMRDNLLNMISSNSLIFEGLWGYENTVLPQIENAIIAGHNFVLLGERGQAKTRILRSLSALLDEEIPVIEGCEINDDPFNPICKHCREIIAEKGDNTPIKMLPRSRRYSEKLATPDTSMANLIGDIDLVKHAQGRVLSDEAIIHYGLIPRTNRGIFAINELPDLQERIQVGLFNVLEERDMQIKGFNITIPLDMFIVASANPEDYTNRGRIVTPLKDRFGAVIRTHYPQGISAEKNIIKQEGELGYSKNHKLKIPDFMYSIVCQITETARKSDTINQKSGVSVRTSIHNLETLAAVAIKRAAKLHEIEAVPRIVDLNYLYSSTSGKYELEFNADNEPEKIFQGFLDTAVKKIFDTEFKEQNFDSFLKVIEKAPILVNSSFNIGHYKELANQITFSENESEYEKASYVEFILEGLHLNNKLKKTTRQNNATYSK